MASWVANVASGRPAFGSRFNTGNMESALLARGFHYGTAPNSVVIGWNGGHAAVTLPDGTPVSSGESGAGVRVGGGGAFQPQFTRHMFLPVEAQQMNDPADSAPEAAPADAPAPAEAVPGEAPPADAPAEVTPVGALPADAPPADAPPADAPPADAPPAEAPPADAPPAEAPPAEAPADASAPVDAPAPAEAPAIP